MAINEDMRAIGALAELDLAPAQQVHKHERMVVERQAHHGPRPHAGDNLGLGILVGTNIYIFDFRKRYSLTLNLEVQYGFI